MKIKAPAMLVLISMLASPVAVSAADKPKPVRPVAPPTSLSLQEARIIIDGAVAWARKNKMRRATIVVVDSAGYLISADRMRNASFHLERFAKGKALASLILRNPTQVAADFAKSRPDRYHGILGMYPGEVYLVGGGLPIALGKRLLGAIGIAGLPRGKDETAARAGLAAWQKFLDSKKN